MKVKLGWTIDPTLKVFRIPLRIKNPKSEAHLTKYCLFDTGFSGYLGLDMETIKRLLLPEKGFGKGVVAKGLIEYKNFEAIIELVDNEDNTIGIIENLDEDSNDNIISVQEFDIPIVGIKVIQQFSWLILAEKKGLFLLE